MPRSSQSASSSSALSKSSGNACACPTRGGSPSRPDEPAADRVVRLAQHEPASTESLAQRRGRARRRRPCPCVARAGRRARPAAASRRSALSPADRPRLERHGVRMPRQPRARCEGDVGLRERDGVRAVERQVATGRPAAPRGAHGIRVHRLGREALQPRDHGVGGAVPDAGRTERAVQRAGDSPTRSSRPSSRRRVAKSRAARMGPTVWELEGPTPMENSSNAET